MAITTGILKIPDWVPGPVIEVSAEILREIASGKRDYSSLAILQNLLSNPSMEQVWDSLRERKRVNNRRAGFRYSRFALPSLDDPIWNEAARPPSKEELSDYNKRFHDIELKGFFQAAFIGAVIRPPVITHSELTQSNRSRQKMAIHLRKVADLEIDENTAAAILKLAESYEGKVSDSKKYAHMIVSRNRGNREIRGLVVHLSQEMQDLFAAGMDGTVAAVTNVILELKGNQLLNGPKVRSILRGARTSSGIKQGKERR